MKFYNRGDIRLHYRDEGTGFPLLIINGGGLDATLNYTTGPFEPTEEFRDRYRCISMDLRNSNLGQSTGPIEADRPWDMHSDDQIALLDHLGVDRFLLMGFCIGNPLIWNLMRRVPERIVAAVTAQPVAMDPDRPRHFYDRNLAKWAVTFRERHPEVPEDLVERYLRAMFLNKDFVITATREEVARCPVPLLVLPDQTPSHPYPASIEMARLAPDAQLSLYPWNDTPEGIRFALRHIRTFLRANTPGA